MLRSSPCQGPGILGGAGAEAPALADLVGHLLADQLGRPAVHRPVAGGIDDDIGGQNSAALHADALRRDRLDLAVLELDRTVGDELRGADIDIVAGAAPQVLHEQAGLVIAEVELEPRRP